MSDPNFTSSFGFFYCDRDPTSDEPVVIAVPIPPNFKVEWWNTVDNSFWWLQNFNTDEDPLIWRKYTDSVNFSEALVEAGININTPRSYSSIPLDINTSRTPSVDNDIFVLADISQTSTILTSATASIQVDSGSGFVTISSPSISGLAATQSSSCNFIVPKGASYKIISSSGTNSISSIYELSF